MKKIRFSEIESIAKSLKIDVVGFTDEYDSEIIEKKLRYRKDNNFDTEFEHPIEERVSPENIMKNWKTMISVGISYGKDLNKNIKYDQACVKIKNKFETPENFKSRNLTGFISKSSIGLDYHIVLTERMKKLVEKLKEDYEFDYFIGVDTTPLVDREIAKNSGVGFYGKNSCIINQEFGSMIFLGYILVDFEIIGVKNSSDNVNSIEGNNKKNSISSINEKEHIGCGDCSLCLKACPTGAIQEGKTMNSRICLSYLTQTKNDIPFELRDKMGKMIYGCDICQNVCPFNLRRIDINQTETDREGSSSYSEALNSETEHITGSFCNTNEIDLEELLFMSNRDFKEKYGASAFSWRGKNILRRNAVIALSKIKTTESVNILGRLLSDGSEMIRKYALWSLYKIDRVKAKELCDYKKELKEELERIEGFYAE